MARHDAKHRQQRTVDIRLARSGDSERLRTITIAAKSHWGYDGERVRAWVFGRDLTPDGLRSDGAEIWVAEVNDQVVGWAAAATRGEVCWLDDLWVEPAHIGQGIGTQLFRCAADYGREHGAVRLEWEAEPHALGFYQRMGAHDVRTELSAWGRTNVVMGVVL